MLAAIICLALGPKPTEGLALSLDFLKQLDLVKATVDQSWSRGCYGVDFVYHVDDTIPHLTAAMRKLPGFKSNQPDQEQFATAWRDSDGVSQTVTFTRAHHMGGGYDGKKQYTIDYWDKFVTVNVSEHPSTFETPLRFYGKAISPNPPAPLIDIPFLKAAKTDTVAMVNLEYLLSSSGKMFPKGNDAVVYGAIVKSQSTEVESSMAKWASANGYGRTIYGSYFKPNTKVFEVEVRPYIGQQQQWTMITLYTTDKPVRNPVAREKF